MSSKTIYGFDARLNWITEEASQTITATGGGGSYAYLIAIINQFGKEPKRNDEITDNQLVIGIDFYNQEITGEVSKTLNSIRSDSDHVPCVLIKSE